MRLAAIIFKGWHSSPITADDQGARAPFVYGNTDNL
jgi:hypothetical protein